MDPEPPTPQRPPDATPVAWQPFTFGGVAAFARAPLRRGWVLLALMALVSGITFMWFLAGTVAPAIDDAIEALPSQGVIRNGRLVWPTPTLTRLVKTPPNPHLTFLVMPQESAIGGEVGDWICVLGPECLRVSSLLGAWEAPYPPDWEIALNRDELNPWWGARKPFILAGAGVAGALGLLVIWNVLGLLYVLPVRFAAFLGDRELRLGGAFKLSLAALMPGALWMCATMVLYRLRWTDLVGVLASLIIHLFVGWVYIGGAVGCLPPASHGELPPEANPFGEAELQEKTNSAPRSDNPFVAPE